MKIVIMTALAAMLMLVFPMAIKAEIVGGFDTTILPEYKGDLNDPDCYVVHQDDKVIVLMFQGNYYIYQIK